MRCKCNAPSDVFNGVCGACLLPLVGTVHAPDGTLTKYRKPKSKKCAKDPALKRIIFELERFGRLNSEDLPTVINALKKLA